MECQVGIADGSFAATLAARRSVLVPPGRSPAFLAPLPITELDQPGDDRGDLVGLLHRLGLRTLGAFAAITEREVAGRFPQDAITAHRLARGLAQRPPVRRALPPDLAITETFEHPLERVDEAAFVAKTLGERFFAGLARHGLACTRLAITALTEAREQRARVWRCAEPLTARATADRVQWQCEGWLTVRDGDRPSTGIVRLTLDPEEVVGGNALQLQLGSMGQDADAAERAGRALARIQGLLGPDAVCTSLLDGGRGPAERVRLVPWGEPRRPMLEDRPWPGRLPTPSPALCRPARHRRLSSTTRATSWASASAANSARRQPRSRSATGNRAAGPRGVRSNRTSGGYGGLRLHVVGAPDETRMADVRWLAGYRPSPVRDRGGPGTIEGWRCALCSHCPGR
ncbi:hypothetical protein [Amycolatopsis sp. NPDC098790]|uniref:hypothetical protein n=1 Tax=Amycolatopsis sp. NPDC098790 TaxID=3363939 RepID=UPI00382D81D7